MSIDDALQQRLQLLLSPGAQQEQRPAIPPSVQSLLHTYHEFLHAQSAAKRVANAVPSESITAVPPAPKFGLLRKRKDPLDREFRPHATGTAAAGVPQEHGHAAAAGPVHWTCRRLSEMTDGCWQAMRQQLGIDVEAHSFLSRGGLFGLRANSIPPIRCWSEMVRHGGAVAAPMMMLQRYCDSRFALPTAIQAQAIPIGLWRVPRHSPGSGTSDSTTGAERLDLLGVAETGSGKTLAYLIPALVHILEEEPLTPQRAELGPLALILVPTRELAEQVAQEARRIVDWWVQQHQRQAAPEGDLPDAIRRFAVIKLVGGESLHAQHDAIARGVHLAVGTPGQLAVLLEQHMLSLGNTTYVSVDEADRMVDEHMTEQLCQVLGHCPVPRQTVMFTATMLPECQEIALKFLSPRGYFLLKTPYTFRSVWQTFELFPPDSSGSTEKDAGFHARFRRLMQWLTHIEGQVIVFANEKQTCDAIEREVRKMSDAVARGLDEVVWGDGEGTAARSGGGPPTDASSTAPSRRRIASSPWIESRLREHPDYQQLKLAVVVHSGMSQQERNTAIKRFQAGQWKVLITTDLLARGLDVSELDLVINFELPLVRAPSKSDAALMQYIHRIGRTGRAGRRGTAVSFVRVSEAAVIRSVSVVQALDRRTLNLDTHDVAPRAARALAGEGDEDDDDPNGTLRISKKKRERTDGDSEDGSGATGGTVVDDSALLKPLYRFLVDCATHSGECRSEEEFAAKCRSGTVERCSIPQPLLLMMRCEAKDLAHGLITR